MSRASDTLAANPEMRTDNPHEWEVQHELGRLGIENDECPEDCHKCGTPLEEASGMVGETIMYCPNDDCDAGVQWEDSEDIIRRVL